MYSIVAFDDHPITLIGMETLFKTHLPSFKFTGYSNSAEVLRHFDDQDVHFLICDLITDEMPGLDLIRSIARDHPRTRVIVYSFVSNNYILQVLDEIGIVAFVSKDDPATDIVDIIKVSSTNKGLKYLHASSVPQLTRRERDILLLMVEGYGSKEIADRLDLSVNTINNQKNRLLKKYDVHNAVALVSKLSKLGYVKMH